MGLVVKFIFKSHDLNCTQHLLTTQVMISQDPKILGCF